jgi:hypothetical protein
MQIERNSMSTSGLIIGVVPGLNTGVAIVEDGRIVELRTCGIAPAMSYILGLHRDSAVASIMVLVKDARIFPGAMDKKLKSYGAGVREGAARREASIWDEFLEVRLIPHKMVPPLPCIASSEGTFLARTGFHGRSSAHSRDAGVIALHYSTADRAVPPQSRVSLG